MRIIVISLIFILLIAGCANPSNLVQAAPTTIPPQATEMPASPLPTIFVRASPIQATLDLSDLTSVAEATQKPIFDKHCSAYSFRYFFNSHWGVCDTDNKAFVVFSVDGRAWQISYIELGIGVVDDGSEFYTRAVYWSEDEEYAYFAPSIRNYDPLGPFYGKGIALVQVNLTDGQAQTILPDVNKFYGISVSPCINRSMPHSESGVCRTPNPEHAAH